MQIDDAKRREVAASLRAVGAKRKLEGADGRAFQQVLFDCGAFGPGDACERLGSLADLIDPGQAASRAVDAPALLFLADELEGIGNAEGGALSAENCRWAAARIRKAVGGVSDGRA